MRPARVCEDPDADVPQEIKKIDIWDYTITLSEDSHPFRPEYLMVSECEADENYPAKLPGPDQFEECYGNGVLSSILAAECVDSDWINGVMLAQIVADVGFNKFAIGINTWHSGCATGLVRGFNHFCVASQYSGRKDIRWSWMGADLKSDRDTPLSTIKLDLTMGRNLIHVANVMKTEYGQVDIIFHDIYPKTPQILISGVVLAMLMLSDRGYLVCRLPDIDKWDQNTLDSMLMISMMFKEIKLWCPPWGRSRTKHKKIYMIAHTKKASIYKSNPKVVMSLLTLDYAKYQFMKASVYSDPKVKGWLNTCQNIRAEIAEDSEPEMTSAALVELLMSNLMNLPQSKKNNIIYTLVKWVTEVPAPKTNQKL